MAAVNWDGTEKVIDQSWHTVTLTNDVIQKSYVVWQQKYPQSKKKKKKQNAIFKKFSTFYFKMPVEAPIFTGNKLYEDDPNN